MTDITIFNTAIIVLVSAHYFLMFLVFRFRFSTYPSIGVLVLFMIVFLAASYFVMESNIKEMEMAIYIIIFHSFCCIPSAFILYRGEMVKKTFIIILNFLFAVFLCLVSWEISRFFLPQTDNVVYFTLIFTALYGGYL
ncbi:MAG: hypothetical protein LBC80_09065, partial [Treponema sp.]|nr:hypothetical protein [Treponema sp.]